MQTSEAGQYFRKLLFSQFEHPPERLPSRYIPSCPLFLPYCRFTLYFSIKYFARFSLSWESWPCWCNSRCQGHQETACITIQVRVSFSYHSPIPIPLPRSHVHVRSHGDVSMVIHKAGNTLLIDELKPSTMLLKVHLHCSSICCAFYIISFQNPLFRKLFEEGKIPHVCC